MEELERVKRELREIIMILLGVVFIVAPFSWFVFMFLWNNIISVIFDITTITFAQSAGIIIVKGLLFKNKSYPKTKKGNHLEDFIFDIIGLSLSLLFGLVVMQFI